MHLSCHTCTVLHNWGLFRKMQHSVREDRNRMYRAGIIPYSAWQTVISVLQNMFCDKLDPLGPYHLPFHLNFELSPLTWLQGRPAAGTCPPFRCSVVKRWWRWHSDTASHIVLLIHASHPSDPQSPWKPPLSLCVWNRRTGTMEIEWLIIH